mgnify:CR=1 FL=1
MQNKITREDFIEFKKHNSINKLYKPENIDYYNFMLNWSPLLSSNYYTDMTRINWIYNDRHSFLSCCICNNVLSGNATDYWGIGYTKTCSHDCRYKSMHLETKKTCIKRYGVTNNLHIPYVEKQI